MTLYHIIICLIKGTNLNVSSEHLNVQAEELKARIIENEKLQSQVNTTCVCTRARACV